MFPATGGSANTRSKRELAKEVIARLQLKVDGGLSNLEEWKVHCPYHLDKTASMFINPDKFVYHCFSCNQSGSVYSLYKDITGRSLNKDLGILTDPFSQFSFASQAYPEPDYSEAPDNTIRVTGIQLPVDTSVMAMRFLRRRGIPLSIAKQMEMTFIERGTINGTPYENRLLIPIKEKNRIISIEGRDVTGQQERKVLYPKNSTVSTLYDIDNLNKEEPLYIVEGLMDLAVLRTDSFFKNSTAIFGASISHRQIYLLNQFEHIIIIPDNDEAGKNSVKKLKEEINKPFDILEVPKLGIKDVGDIPGKLFTTVEAIRKRGWARAGTLKSSLAMIFY